MSEIESVGYPKGWFIDPPDEFLCGFCENIVYNPYQCRNGHLFCLLCVEDAARTSCTQCPTCDASLNLKYKSVAAKLSVDKLHVHCEAKFVSSGGCSWVGTLLERESHVCGTVSNSHSQKIHAKRVRYADVSTNDNGGSGKKTRTISPTRSTEIVEARTAPPLVSNESNPYAAYAVAIRSHQQTGSNPQSNISPFNPQFHIQPQLPEMPYNHQYHMVQSMQQPYMEQPYQPCHEFQHMHNMTYPQQQYMHPQHVQLYNQELQHQFHRIAAFQHQHQHDPSVHQQQQHFTPHTSITSALTTSNASVLHTQAGSGGETLHLVEGTYTGDVLNGKRHGVGTMVYKNGSTYRGQWIFDLRDGHGIHCSDKGVYDGQWQRGFKHGRGCMKWSDGGSYSGDFVHNMYEGQGTLVSVSGNFYTGAFAQNHRCGYGEMKYKKGDSYRGMWKRNMKEGRGVERGVDGTIREGLFREGKWMRQWRP